MAQWLERRARDPKGAGSSHRMCGRSLLFFVVVVFPGSTVCANFKSYFGVRSMPVLPQQHVKDPAVILPKVLVAGYACYHAGTRRMRPCLKLH